MRHTPIPKPCPFCAAEFTTILSLIEDGEPELYVVAVKIAGYWGLDCNSCGIAQHPRYKTLFEAITMWNRRV